MNKQFDREELDKMRNDPDNYKLGFFYFNQKDHRFIVPKKIGIGMTLNFGNPYAYLVIIGIIIFAIVIGNI